MTPRSEKIRRFNPRIDYHCGEQFALNFYRSFNLRICDHCGEWFVPRNGRQRFCKGCAAMRGQLRYQRHHCHPINCADCGRFLVAQHVTQVRCASCRISFNKQRAKLNRMNRDDRAEYAKLRSNPERWARKMETRKAAYQRLVRDPKRYAKYLQWKRNWYRQRQDILIDLLADPSEVLNQLWSGGDELA